LNRRFFAFASGLILAAGLSASTACGPPPLQHTSPSVAELATTLLDALARRDETALRALALSETEFRDRIWPSLPAARPERNLPLSYVWGDLQQKSDAGLRTTLNAHGGRRYVLADPPTLGQVTNYPQFRVYKATAWRLRSDSGEVLNARLCGSLVEQSGRWKAFSFVVDD
jgi:hypothetical protein